jgi:hypothetical protein
MNTFKQTLLPRLAASQRATVGTTVGRRLLIFLPVSLFLVVSGSNISNVHASGRGRIAAEVVRHQTAQGDEAEVLVHAAHELYQRGRFDEALAKCTKAIAVSPNDARPHAIAGLVWRHNGK